jgi:alkanesulfonate monooxygenase SsuD/methylene tetrahydromethanopterin reductase-like flavin-dependent oxidoreductase (luciferase family)
MWMACTNRETIKVAASLGLGALAFSFVNPNEARLWSEIYYGIIKSENCIPLGHDVNAQIAMVSSFSVHRDRAEAIRRGHEGFEFFGYALNALVAHDTVPGRTNLWGEYLKLRGERTEEIVALTAGAGDYASGIGTPEDMRKHLRGFQDAGIDQVIFLQQAGRNTHQHICQSLELFAAEVMPDFKAEVAGREQRKAAELKPYVEAALRRKAWMKPLADHEIPVVKASVARAQVSGGPKVPE